jgi:hypothetical protein
MIRRGSLLAVLVGLGVAGAVRPANAFVRYETQTGNPFSWRAQTVNVVGYPHGLPDVPTDQITHAMTASVSAWSKEDPASGACSFLGLALSMQPVTAIPPAAVHDDKNIIAIRDGDWEAICSTTKEGKTICHMSGELALTTVWSRACGEIVEADVEVNASTDFNWADLSSNNNPGLHDLQNALTHEMGHFIGLDHTCLLGALIDPVTKEPIEPVDNNGQKVPFCSDSDLTPAEHDATMYPSAQPGDVSKRSLTEDDRLGLCSIYPTGTVPAHCGTGSSNAACAVASEGGAERGDGSGRGRQLVAGLALIGLALGFRRRSSRG